MNRLLALLVFTAFLTGTGGTFAADVHSASLPAGGAVLKGPALVEQSGIIEVKPAETGQRFDTVFLKVGQDSFVLVPGKARKIMAELRKLVGKHVTVKGTVLPANAKHPLAGFKVEGYALTAAATAAPPTSETPATATVPATQPPARTPPAGK